jgi:hypothetical protein
MHITVGDDGVTRRGEGASNAQVCLKSDRNAFMNFMMERLAD